jgi:peptidoglycan/LPS O-acetylase OafA/YrhL
MPSGKNHLAELDGLGGIAILLVCIFHFGFVLGSSSSPFAHKLQNVLWLGWAGVDLFFALSGFLITGILLDSLDSTSYFRTFYIRRALRIFPLYSAFLAVTLGLMHHILWRHKYPGIVTWWYLTYLQNWKPNHTAGDLHVDHLWSLAVEEQFYMAWPLLIWITPRKYYPR